jgi:hypothetical protein
MTSRILAVAAALAICLPGLAMAAHEDDPADAPGRPANVSISDTAHVPEGQVHDNDIVTISGDVKIDGKVSGDVVVIAGTLDLEGTVDGQVVLIMSEGHLGEEAEIGGDLVSVGGHLDRAPEARIGGEVVSLNLGDLLPPLGHGGWTGLARLFYVLELIKLAGLFLAMLLVTALVPARLSVIATAFPRRWGMAILAGLVAYCVTFVLCLILAVTIIGIPLAIALWFVVKVIKWIGLAAILYLIGGTAGKNLFKRDLAHAPAVLGGFVVYAILSLIPLFGWVVCMTMSVLALGMSLLTRFGSAEDGWRRAAPAGPAGGMVPPPPPPPPVVPGT